MTELYRLRVYGGVTFKWYQTYDRGGLLNGSASYTEWCLQAGSQNCGGKKTSFRHVCLSVRPYGITGLPLDGFV